MSKGYVSFTHPKRISFIYTVIEIAHDRILFAESSVHQIYFEWASISNFRGLRNRSALAVNCCVIIHCLEVSCKEGQTTSAQRE